MSNIKISIGGNPIVGVLGLIIIVFVLVHNEMSYICSTKVANIAKKAVNVSAVSASNDNKLIHIVGKLKTDDIITDGLVSVNAVVLERNVEEYKEEEEEGAGKGNYRKTFSGFQYEDGQRSFKCGSDTQIAENVYIDGLQLSPGVIRELNASESYELPRLPYGSNLTLYGKYYYTHSPVSPQIGDFRVSYKYLPPGKTYSIIAKQSGNSLVPYREKGPEVMIAKEGSYSKNDMLNDYTLRNEFGTNTTRLISLLVLWVALNCIVGPVRFILSLMGKSAGVLEYYGAKETFLAAVMVYSAIAALIWLQTNLLVSIILIVIIGLIYNYLSKLKTK